MHFPALFLAAATVLLPPQKPSASMPPLTPALSAPRPREHLLSPKLHVHPGLSHAPRVALTLDACTGKVDERILKALIANNIKATVFVTARWLKRNPEALKQMLARSDLFEIENHGARHLAAIDHPDLYFGVKAAASAEGIRREIEDGAAAVKQATGREPHWYRGAAAEYTASALPIISSLGFKLAGYSLAGDGGATYSARRAALAIAGAQNGDVIIAHINQPMKPAGVGVVEGILALKAKGYIFVRLDDRHLVH